MAPSGFYAVAHGRSVGVYRSWNECKKQVDGFTGARFKKFASAGEAESFIAEHKNSKVTSTSTFNARPSSSTALQASRKRAAPSTPAVSILPKRLKGTSGWDEVPVIYTDGACSNNGRQNAKAGYGVYWGPGSPDNCCGPVNGEPTNNRGELLAVDVALQQAIDKGLERVLVRTDSMLLINSLDLWIEGWKKKGWKTAAGQPVKNTDLLIGLDEKMKKILVRFEHVSAHCGIEGNEAADELARKGAEQYEKA